MTIKIKTKNGNIGIDNDVIASIVGGAAIENPGVIGMASRAAFRDGVNQILNRENYGRGVVVHQTDDGLGVDVHIVVQYGNRLNDISQSVQKKVKYNLDRFLGVSVAEVNVIVQGVRTSD
ncbi:Asp23/Gls24 family envelope stress response protein [Leuconostocaceae bacterium ESL0723]|nr:Asp23/Gls24 family envelope stress response protein [Lactobacillaceae bacterium L1_55_11]WEV54088.1 Asp23/Gls24 family envelope stress response protein [Leuconostocaceae bacterium ESL0723]